jgi:hypothetical protein
VGDGTATITGEGAGDLAGSADAGGAAVGIGEEDALGAASGVADAVGDADASARAASTGTCAEATVVEQISARNGDTDAPLRTPVGADLHDPALTVHL